VNPAADLLDAAAALAEVDDLDVLPPLALRVLRRTIPCSIAAWNDLDPEAGRVVGTLDPPETAIAELEALFARYGHQNPLYRHHLETGDVGPYAISDFLDRDAFHALELYQHLYRRLGVEHQMAAVVPSPPPQVLAVTLNRGDRDFDADARERLRLLMPHIGRAYDRCRARAGLRRDAERLRAAMDLAGLALVVAGPEGDVREVTVAARSLLERSGVPIDGRRRPPVRRGTRAASAETSLDGLRATATRSGDEVLILLERTSPVPDSDPRLSTRELEVLAQAADGLPAKAVAQRLGITERTVHAHLRNVYRKLGATSLASAIAALRNEPAR
jgi:DNA-binding CsgD family transcriptional regulator